MILASELTHKGLWYPTILGVLVVVAAVVLFCGSAYLLLGTNLGARLGFLVAFTGLMGFLVLLSLLWCTTASPLNTLKGRIPQWKVQQVVTDLDKADNEHARTIADKANKVTDSSEAANVKAAVDEALVKKVALPTLEVTPEDNRYAAFDDVTQYQILQTFEVGGSDPQFWKGQFTHSEEVAVVQFCEVAKTPDDRPFGLPPLPPECADGGKTGYVVLTRDLGSLRLPPFVAFVTFSILFLLGLLMLHWRERDEQEAEVAAQQGDAAPERVPAKV
ncbi:MAG TPA: hypothetical protein VFZ17_13940 [Acidimicrobiia bacterium]|nr:hypothetical protein [Acidimicrobiia bacterium]